MQIGTYVNYNPINFEEGPDGNCGLFPLNNNEGQLGAEGRQFLKIYALYMWANMYPVTSDKRLKENFRDIESPLGKILQVKGLKYDFNDEMVYSIRNEKIQKEIKERNKNRLGIIAQDLEEIIPEAVIYNNEDDKYYIDYYALVPVIIEAMKEQQLQIEAQAKQMLDLEKRLEQLEKKNKE